MLVPASLQESQNNRPRHATLDGKVRTILAVFLVAAPAAAQLQITTSSVPVAAQYQSYSTTLTASGGTPPYTWSVVQSTGVSLPEGMSLNPSTGVVNAAQVNGQGGYAVTVEVTDSSSPHPNTATATIDFGVTSDGGYGGCEMFPADSIYNQRIDLLPVDTNPAHQIPSNYLKNPLHPDFGHGFYPSPGGIPFLRVPANQPAVNVNLQGGGQLDPAGTYAWPFPAWPNAVIEGTSYGADGNDHHLLILESSVDNISGPQIGPCTLYETYQSTAVPDMFNSATSTWLLLAGLHYVTNSNTLAASSATLDNGAQDSAGIPIVPLLIKYSEVPLGAQHPLRITFPSPTNWFVWPATGCCTGSGPPQGLLYRLKASVNWQAVCPTATNPQAATVLQTLQQYGAYMSDHGSAGFIQGVPDVRWDDDDLACIKQFHVSDLEVADNSALEVSPLSGQTQPYVVPATLPQATAGAAYGATLSAVGGNPEARQWSITSGSLPPGLTLDRAAGTINGIPNSAAATPFSFDVTATDSESGYASMPQAFSIAVGAASFPVVVESVTNSASGAAGAIAPGELVTLKGTGLGPAAAASFASTPVSSNLAGTQVLFGSTPAPILYVSAAQINVVVPWEVDGQTQVTVQVKSAAGTSAILNVQVTDAAPGVFTLNSTGAGAAVAFNPDGSVNGSANPASPGSYVSVYFTGGGPIHPPGADGSVTVAAQPLTQSTGATVGGVAATVTYAGSAPEILSGVDQLNILLPPATPAGNAVPLVLTVAGRSSPATATLSVQ